MRVAHVSDCYLPRTGGIELQVRGLSQAQAAAGFSPEIITATPAAGPHPVIPGEFDGSVPVHRLAVRLPAELPVSPHVGKRLRELLLDTADVVHVHGGLVSPFAWPALRTAVRAGLPAVVSVHSVWANWSRAFTSVNAISGWREWPVVWTTVSKVAAVPLQRALGSAAQVQILPNGIDVQRWAPKSAPVTKDPSVVTVVAVARLAMRKRSLELIEALDRARQLVPRDITLRAVLVGDGPDRAKVERQLQRRAMSWVELAGWRDHDQIADIYAASDIFVAPAILESFGIAALEARTSGLPVVARSQTGITEFIRDEREGLLADDDPGLAVAIARLATDAELRGRIATHNRTVPPEFSWPDVIGAAEQYYQQAISLAAQRRP